MCVIIIRIMKNLITYLLLVLLSATVASAQQSGVQPAFRNGEVLTLKVSYRAKLIPNTEVATVVMSVADTTINGHPYYCIYANARTMPSWRWFYNLNDTYRSYIDTTTFRPVLSTSQIRENGYRAWSRFEYDWDKGVSVNTKQRKQDPPTEHRIPIEGESYDGVSLFYDLRTIDPATLVEDEDRTIALLLNDTVRYITTAIWVATARKSATWVRSARSNSRASWRPRRARVSRMAPSSSSGSRTTAIRSPSSSSRPSAWAVFEPISAGSRGCVSPSKVWKIDENRPQHAVER